MQPEIIQEMRSTGMEEKYLTFKLADRIYAIDISYLVEILPLPEITEIPDMKDYVKGVIDLRGRVVAVFDARSRLGLPEIEYYERTCLIVLSFQSNSIGLIVDLVNEVIKIPKESIDLVHTNIGENQDHCIKGMSRIKDDVVILINIENFIFADHSQI